MSTPSKNGLLVASPQMLDVFFSKTVILLCEYSEDGAVGLVVNRLTGIEAEQVLNQMGVGERGGIQAPVHWGGPVQPGAVFLTYARSGVDLGDVDEGEGVFTISPKLAVSPNKDIIESVSAAGDISSAFLSLGYAGWGAGQLDGEIESGSWIYMELDEDLLFRVPPEERWDRCIESMGIDPRMIWMQPINE